MRMLAFYGKSFRRQPFYIGTFQIKNSEYFDKLFNKFYNLFRKWVVSEILKLTSNYSRTQFSCFKLQTHTWSWWIHCMSMIWIHCMSIPGADEFIACHSLHVNSFSFISKFPGILHYPTWYCWRPLRKI